MSKIIKSSTFSMSLKQNLVSILLLCFLLCGVAVSQVLYGTLTGNVTDQSGAVVAGANIVATNLATGVSTRTITDDNGIYRIQTLQPGNYKVAISASNFSTQLTQSLTVTASTVARVDASLKLAQQKDTVTVTTEAPLLQTDKADVHTELTTRQIEDLPTAGTQGRNFQSLLRIVPGTGITAETNSLAGNPQRAINTNVNGQSNQTNNTRIDGAQDWYAWLPANVAYVPPADAIETVNVTTNAFDAEQGTAGGAAVNVQIKSGTNTFHGSGHEFYTSQLFQARTYFNADPNLPGTQNKNKNIQHQFGGTIGGPIIKNKLFFFGDYERTTQRQLAGPVTATLPTVNMANGDFRGLTVSQTVGGVTQQVPVIIYDPMTGNADGSGKQQISCNGVLNVICPDRIDPAATKMVQLLQPDLAKLNATGDNLNNFVGSGTALFNRDTADIKVNYVPNQKSTIFARYSLSKTLVFDPPFLGDAVGNATNGGQLGNAPGLIQSVGLGATYTFTPNLLLDWNAGFTRQRLGSTFDLSSAKGLNDLGIPGTNNAGTVGDPSLYYGLPGFIFPTNNAAPSTTGQIGTSLGNAQPANPFLFRDQQYVTGANLSWIKGKHALRGGLEWNHAQINHFQPQGGTFQQPRGSFEFNGYATSNKGGTLAPQWFNSWADFMLGLPEGTGKAIQLFNPNALRWNQWAWYLRDQWQVTPRLTVSLGVRWEYYPFGYSDNGKGLRYFDVNTGNVLVGGFGNVPRNDGIDVGSGQFLPRIGIAYRLMSSTVIRAGFGQSADPNNWRYFRNAFPSVVLVTNTAANNQNFVPVASLTGLNSTGIAGGSVGPLQTGILLPPLPDLSTGVVPLPQNVGTTTVQNPFHRGYINSFNFMIQHDWKGTVIETGYVGARGIRPLVFMNANAALPGQPSSAGVLSVALTNAGVCSPCNYSGNPGIGVPFKNNWYDSMQTKVTRRFAGGSSAGFVWTWSKATSYADNEDLGFLTFAYPTQWEKNRSVANFDRTHNFEIYGVLQSPFGRGQHWLQTGIGNAILGGWQFNPIISKATGLPFTVTAPNGTTADLVGKFHVLNGKPPQAHPGPTPGSVISQGQQCTPGVLSCHYFDPTAFAQPAAGMFGNTYRNEFRGPGYFQMNLSVHRAFNLTEKVVLDLRADMINFTNTPHFANPNAGCAATGPGLTCAGGTFGAVTAQFQPGGFFGPDPGQRITWFGGHVTF
jgi:hypothetical protein